MAPGGGIFSHVDYKRDTAKLIPIGPNKGEIHYHLHWKWKPFTLINIRDQHLQELICPTQ